MQSKKEMKNCRVAFKVLEEDEHIPIRYKWIKCHMIFDVKMDFTRKVCFVAGGHMMDSPDTISCSSVVSRDSIRIAFLITALNDISIQTCDIGNAYLNALLREKVYRMAGADFGNECQGKNVLIVRALHGLKSSGAAWHSHLASTLYHQGYTSSLADPDVWFRTASKPDGFEYYEYILVYVDDLLVLSHEPQKTMKALESFYRLKEGYAEPTRYLGAEVRRWHFPDTANKSHWALSSSKYVKEAVRNIENHLQPFNRALPKVQQPLPSNYYPELDITPLFNDEETNQFQSFISILRWIVELGCLDIYVHMVMLSLYLMNPRVGHTEALYYIFGYLKSHDRSTMVFDDVYLNWNNADFPSFEWTEFYPHAHEDIRPNAPPQRGNPIHLNVFVDASHASNNINRRSHTGILIYANRSPII